MIAAVLVPIAFKCMTGTPTTTFKVRTEGNEVIVETIHHNGTAYMPVHKGIIVPADLPYLEAKSKILSKMGAKNEFRFPLDKCKIYGKELMSCRNGTSQVFGGTKMTASFFNTTKAKHQVFEYEVETTTVSLTVQVEGFVPVQEITMDYAEGDCEFQLP